MNADELNARFLAAHDMDAIGMTATPLLSRVADYVRMLRVPTPRPARGEVALSSRASALHIDEVYAAQGTALGRFGAPVRVSTQRPALLGSLSSGVIVALGPGVHGVAVGDEVLVVPSASSESGAWAQYRCVPARRVMLKPASLSHVQAVALTMAGCVAWTAADLRARERDAHCVVVGASGAVGVILLQLLKRHGCRVTAVCSAASEEFVRTHGADDVIPYDRARWGDRLLTRRELQDAVFDCVGGRGVEAQARRALRPNGEFRTVVGPVRHIGERRLSLWTWLGHAFYVLGRMAVSRLDGPKYTFVATVPPRVAEPAMAHLVTHGIEMPIERVIPFDARAVASAILTVSSHRTRGRIVIDFSEVTTTSVCSGAPTPG